jgi:hypothetical protein
LVFRLGADVVACALFLATLDHPGRRNQEKLCWETLMTDYVAQAQLAEELRKHGVDPARLPPACLHEFVAKAESVADVTRALHGSASEALSDHLYGMAALIAQTLRGEAPGENCAKEILSRHGIAVRPKTEAIPADGN